MEKVIVDVQNGENGHWATWTQEHPTYSSKDLPYWSRQFIPLQIGQEKFVMDIYIRPLDNVRKARKTKPRAK